MAHDRPARTNADAATTPAGERCVTSYPVRRRYRPGVVYPPEISSVRGTVDVHAHAHPGQQDAFATAQYASRAGMRAIIFKTITGAPDPLSAVRGINERLARWCESEGVQPVICRAGLLLGARGIAVTGAAARAALESGITALWLPVFNHANTLATVGGRPIWWDPTADPEEHTGPLPWDEARRYGHYLLGDDGGLLPEVREIVRICSERDAPLFFGHATHSEIFALAEEMQRIGYTRGVVDHPFSPFIDLSIDEMQQLAHAGVTLNFTYDELSPLLGIDPARMAAAIKALGAEHCTISSDVGEPLFPNVVEAMRQIYSYMEAFGLTRRELDRVARINPARIAGVACAIPV